MSNQIESPIRKRKPGLRKGRLGLLSRQQKPNRMLRTKSYRVSPSISTSISSGSVILAIGLGIGLSIPALDIQATYGFTAGFDTPNAVGGLMILIVQYTIGIIFDINKVIGSMILGWFIGAIIASLIYDQEGKRGPLYSSIIAISLMFAFIFIVGIVYVSKGNINFGDSFLPIIAAVVLSLLMAIISIPLILVALIGYKVGGLIADV